MPKPLSKETENMKLSDCFTKELESSKQKVLLQLLTTIRKLSGKANPFLLL